MKEFSDAFPYGVGDCIAVYRDWYLKRPTAKMLQIISENYSPESHPVQEMFATFEQGEQDAFEMLAELITVLCWQTGAIRFLTELHGMERLSSFQFQRLTAVTEQNRQKVFEQFQSAGSAGGFRLEALSDNGGLDLRMCCGGSSQA